MSWGVISTSGPITWLCADFRGPSNLVRQQARWLDLLGEFDCEIEYRPGYKHGNADALLRRSYRSCLFYREPWESECMVIFTSPETRPDSEDRWAPEPLEKAQREDRDLMTLINWRTVSDARLPWEEVQRHGDVVKDL